MCDLGEQGYRRPQAASLLEGSCNLAEPKDRSFLAKKLLVTGKPLKSPSERAALALASQSRLLGVFPVTIQIQLKAPTGALGLRPGAPVVGFRWICIVEPENRRFSGSGSKTPRVLVWGHSACAWASDQNPGVFTAPCLGARPTCSQPASRLGACGSSPQARGTADFRLRSLKSVGTIISGCACVTCAHACIRMHLHMWAHVHPLIMRAYLHLNTHMRAWAHMCWCTGALTMAWLGWGHALTAQVWASSLMPKGSSNDRAVHDYRRETPWLPPSGTYLF